MMKLKQFRVTEFRSVRDSGWIDVDDVTALVGINESGKSNILTALWKLNPAKGGEINALADFPRKHYNDMRSNKKKPVFVAARFEASDSLSGRLSKITNCPAASLRSIAVSRRLDGNFDVDFPDVEINRSEPGETLTILLAAAISELQQASPLRSEQELQSQMIARLQATADTIDAVVPIQVADIRAGCDAISSLDTSGAPKTSRLLPIHERVISELEDVIRRLNRPHPRDNDEVLTCVVENLPHFVYYSTYGNLDSEIYLPHVIDNLKRSDLGQREEAKSRTLRVLFEFVKLSPEEILELGRELESGDRAPTEPEIAAIAERKKERSVLLQSASALLTQQFRDWWKQGVYRFRFDADGDHFRIWVSDDKRPEEIELEGRSSGLQWFLSFYLVFLVERSDAHDDAILLLDEPGLSLHPLAQRDLSRFFDGLAEENQLIYTCHSPFLVDADRLDRVRKVYVESDGTSVVTANLRESGDDAGRRGASYAVHAALGLSVAESLLLGCEAIVVEGPSDQHYLVAMKNLLISGGHLTPGRELIFVPAGGVKGVRPIASILGGRDEDLPVALFDSDAPGRAATTSLRGGLYAASPAKVLEVETFTGMQESEIEDLIPREIICDQMDRWHRPHNANIADEIVPGSPIVPLLEEWADKHGIALARPGWKVELAVRVKQFLLSRGPSAVNAETIQTWKEMFEALQSQEG